MKRTDGFVLLQLLAGILVLLALTIMLTPGLMNLAEMAAESRVEEDFEILTGAFDRFYVDTATYPATAPPGTDPGLTENFRLFPGWNGPYLEAWPRAPLDSKYRYLALPLENSDRIWVGLQFYGRDKTSWLSGSEFMAKPEIPADLWEVEREITRRGDDIFFLIACISLEFLASESRPAAEKAVSPTALDSLVESSNPGDVSVDEGQPDTIQFDAAEPEKIDTNTILPQHQVVEPAPAEPLEAETGEPATSPQDEATDPWRSLISGWKDETIQPVGPWTKPAESDSSDQATDQKTTNTSSGIRDSEKKPPLK